MGQCNHCTNFVTHSLLRENRVQRLVMEALLWAFAQALQPHFYPETKAAWKAVLEDIAKEMQAG